MIKQVRVRGCTCWVGTLDESIYLSTPALRRTATLEAGTACNAGEILTVTTWACLYQRHLGDGGHDSDAASIALVFVYIGVCVVCK